VGVASRVFGCNTNCRPRAGFQPSRLILATETLALQRPLAAGGSSCLLVPDSAKLCVEIPRKSCRRRLPDSLQIHRSDAANHPSAIENKERASLARYALD
jgi:hypothetical protein